MPSFSNSRWIRGAPQSGFRLRHRPNQGADIGGYGRSTGASAAFPRPVQSEVRRCQAMTVSGLTTTSMRGSGEARACRAPGPCLLAGPVVNTSLRPACSCLPGQVHRPELRSRDWPGQAFPTAPATSIPPASSLKRVRSANNADHLHDVLSLLFFPCVLKFGVETWENDS